MARARIKMERNIPDVPKDERYTESHIPVEQDMYADLKKIEERSKIDVRNDSGIVHEIMRFDDYKKFTDYSKKFDWVQSDFIKTLITVVLDELLASPTEKDFFIELEDGVKLHFGVNLGMQSIFMEYEDTRFNRIVECRTPKQKPQPVYYDPYHLTPSITEFDSHSFYNRPIIHHVNIIHKQNNENKYFVDVEKTLEHFIYEFIVFANVIDVEHEGVLWVAKKEEERKQMYNTDHSASYGDRPQPYSTHTTTSPPLPTKPKPRTII